MVSISISIYIYVCIYIYIYLVGVVTGNSKSLCCRQDSVTLQDIAFLDLWAAWLKGFRLVRLMACTHATQSTSFLLTCGDCLRQSVQLLIHVHVYALVHIQRRLRLYNFITSSYMHVHTYTDVHTHGAGIRACLIQKRTNLPQLVKLIRPSSSEEPSKPHLFDEGAWSTVSWNLRRHAL